MPANRLPRVPVLALLIACLLSVASRAAAPAKQEEPRARIAQTVLNATAIKPGSSGMIAVQLDLKDGFHAQSSTPLEEFLIKFTAKLESGDGVKAGTPILPAGEVKEFKGVG